MSDTGLSWTSSIDQPREDRGVSPVIGVILMVAVTVIIAAVIGSSALGLSEEIGETPPNAQFTVEETEADLQNDDGHPLKTYPLAKIAHTSGETVDMDSIEVRINGEPAYATIGPFALSGEVAGFDHVGTDDGNNDNRPPVMTPKHVVGDRFTAGDEITLVLGTTHFGDEDLTISKSDGDNVYYHTHGDTIVNVINGESLGEGTGARLASGDVIEIIWESDGQSQLLYEHEYNG